MHREETGYISQIKTVQGASWIEVQITTMDGGGEGDDIKCITGMEGFDDIVTAFRNKEIIAVSLEVIQGGILYLQDIMRLEAEYKPQKYWIIRKHKESGYPEMSCVFRSKDEALTELKKITRATEEDHTLLEAVARCRVGASDSEDID